MRKKYALSILLLISAHCYAMQTQFFVHDRTGDHFVKQHDVSPFLRSLTPAQLQKYNEVGNRVRAIKLSNGDYRIQEDSAIKGGGPWLATLVAAVGYPVVAVSALGATIASVPAVGPACFAVGWGVAFTGTVAVTKGVIAAAVVPTP
jgi:hypothetical protein